MNRYSYHNFEKSFFVPEKGIFVVYKITIGEKCYIGSTYSMQSRMSGHKYALNRIAESKTNIKTGYYSKFNYKDIIKHGYSFSILKTAQTLSECIELEKEVIREHDATSLLNINLAKKKIKNPLCNQGRKSILKSEKKIPITIWVKTKHRVNAKKDVLEVQSKYALLT